LQTSVRIHRGDSIIADGIKKGWALLPAKRPAGPVIHKLIDPLGDLTPGPRGCIIAGSFGLRDLDSGIFRRFRTTPLYDLLR
jgi:hypothetical protein